MFCLAVLLKYSNMSDAHLEYTFLAVNSIVIDWELFSAIITYVQIFYWYILHVFIWTCSNCLSVFICLSMRIWLILINAHLLMLILLYSIERKNAIFTHEQFFKQRISINDGALSSWYWLSIISGTNRYWFYGLHIISLSTDIAFFIL